MLESSQSATVKELLHKHSMLFDSAEFSFKASQLSTLGLSHPILNEFHYCARSQADMLKLISIGIDDSNIEQFRKFVETANLAAACIINDSVDLLVIYVRRTIANLNRKFEAQVESGVESKQDYLKVLLAIEKVEQVISSSRLERLNRIDMYTSIVKDGFIECITAFAIQLPRIEVQLRSADTETRI